MDRQWAGTETGNCPGIRETIVHSDQDSRQDSMPDDASANNGISDISYKSFVPGVGAQTRTAFFREVALCVQENYQQYRQPVEISYSTPFGEEHLRSRKDLFPEDLEAELNMALAARDESFSRMVLRKIGEKGMTSVQCYKKAGVDRKHFAKIRAYANYRPTMSTAVAFAIALELDFEEAQELLAKAGYTFSPSRKFDIIVGFFLKKRVYDLHLINEALYLHDQPLIGEH